MTRYNHGDACNKEFYVQEDLVFEIVRRVRMAIDLDLTSFEAMALAEVMVPAEAMALVEAVRQ